MIQAKFNLAIISNRKDSGGPSPARPTSAYTVGHSRTQNLLQPVPLSEFIPPLPSTTSSLINNPFPIDDPLSHQQPHPSLTTPLLSTTLSPFNDPHPSSITPLLSTTPSPINNLIPHQQPLSYQRPPLPSTTSSIINNPSFIDKPLSHQRSHPLSTTPSAIDDLVSYQQPLLPSTSSGINNLFYLSITSSPT